MDYLKKFLQFINDNQLFDKEDKILIGFSGGKDSVFLTHLMLSLDFNISLAHLNHSLRGDESIRDMEFCKKFAEKYGLKIFIKTVDVKNAALKKKISIEEAGRYERYKFFESLCDKYKFTKYATAHHLDDQVETFFINFFRKKSLFSLKGINIKTKRCIRPILCFTKNEIVQYLKENNLEFIEDSSNQDIKFLRNKIRLELIPFIENNFKIKLNNVIKFYSTQFKDLETIIFDKINELFNLYVKKDSEGFSLKVTKINSELLRKELYKKILEELNIDYSEKILNRIDTLYNSSKNTGKIFVKNFKIFKEYDKLFFEKNSNEKFLSKIIESEGEYLLFNKFKIIISSTNREQIKKYDEPNTQFLDLKKVKFPLKIRFFKEGDRFQPLGFEKQTKLKKFFINQKIPFRMRKKLLLFEDKNGEIILIQNLRISEKVKIDKTTDKVLKIKILLN